jgi:proteic killer suppression protein
VTFKNVAAIDSKSGGAKDLDDLKIPPGNRIEALTGNRKGQHSLRINDQ